MVWGTSLTWSLVRSNVLQTSVWHSDLDKMSYEDEQWPTPFVFGFEVASQGPSEDPCAKKLDVTGQHSPASCDWCSVTFLENEFMEGSVNKLFPLSLHFWRWNLCWTEWSLGWPHRTRLVWTKSCISDPLFCTVASLHWNGGIRL